MRTLGSEKLSDLPIVVQMVNSKITGQTQVYLNLTLQH